MPDEKLRELERRWQETDDPDDEARFLRASLRAGALAREVLERAAHLEHEPAHAALGTAPPEHWVDWGPWAQEIGSWSQEAAVRAAVAFAMGSIPWANRFDGPDDRLLATVQAVERWVSEPGPEAEADVRSVLGQLDEVHATWAVASFCTIAHSMCLTVLEPELARRHVTEVFSLAARQRRHLASLRRVVRAELVDWVLCRRDAIAERLNTQGRWLVHLQGIVREVLSLEDGRLIAVTGDGCVYRARLQPLELSGLPPQRRDIYAAAVNPSGELLVTGDVDGRLCTFDLSQPDAEAQPLDSEEDAKARDSILSLRFLPDGERVLAACGDGSVQLWDTRERTLHKNVICHAAKVSAVSPTPDGARFLTGSRDGSVRLWDTATAKDELRLWARDGQSVVDLAFLPDGAFALVAWDDGHLELLDTHSGPQQTYAGQTGSVHALAVSTDGQFVATLADTVCVWDVRSGDLLHTWWVDGTHLALTFTPDGSLISGARIGGLFRFTRPAW